MFSGWTESQAQTDARAWRIALCSIGYASRLTDEADADRLHELVKSGDPVTGEQADIARWQDEVEVTRKSDYPI